MPVVDYDTDPYKDIPEQAQDVASYSINSLRIFWLLPVALAISIIVDTSLRAGRVSIPIIVIMAVISLALISIQVSRVTLDESGILIRYWLLPNRHIPWPAICELTIKNTVASQATAAIISCGKSSRRAFLTFFLGYLPKEGAGMAVDTLNKTVIVRAGLTDMKRSGWGNVTYRRPQ